MSEQVNTAEERVRAFWKSVSTWRGEPYGGPLKGTLCWTVSIIYGRSHQGITKEEAFAAAGEFTEQRKKDIEEVREEIIEQVTGIGIARCELGARPDSHYWKRIAEVKERTLTRLQSHLAALLEGVKEGVA